MTTLAEHIIVAGVENRPPMLEKSMYDSWVSHTRLFIKGKKHGKMMLDSIENDPLVYPTVEENGKTRPMKYSKLTEAQQLQDDCDVQATNIILHRLRPDVYALVNHQEAAKDIWDRVKLLMKGTELSYQERKCRLYNLLDKFDYVQGETLYEYYWRFSQLINNMHTIGMTMQQVQVNTKFLNALPSEWSKFVTDVKLAKSLYTTNHDQLYGYRSQNERQANEVRVTHERYSKPLAFLVVPMFQQGEDSIECINKAMAFLSAIALRFPPSNNQLRTSFNPRNQATIQDGRVTIHQVQGRQNQSYDGTRNRGIATTSKGNYAAGQPRVVKCYNYQGKGHMSRQCTQPNGQGMLHDCDDLSSAKAVMMANLSSCDPEVLSESQDAVIQDTNSSAPNDLLVLSLVEQMTDHVAHLDKENQTNKMVNESLTAELERYKERVTIFEQRLNVDLNKREKLIDSQMDDLIWNRNAKLVAFQQEIDTLKETLSNNVKEKDVIAKEHVVIFVFDDEETLILEEESRSKMLDKQNDPISIKKKIKISLIDYSKLNKIKEYFGKRFVTKKELSAEEAFWLKHSSFSETPVTSHTPVRIEAPSELPKSQEKDTVIRKLKDRIKSLSRKDSLEKVKIDIDEIETINIELDHTLKKELRKLKGKNVVDTTVSKPNATIASGMFKLDIEPISQRLQFNRDAHEIYIDKTIENTDTLCGFTCPNSPKPSEMLVAVTPMNTDKRVRFVEPVTSSSNIPKQNDSLKPNDSNKSLLTSTGVKPTTSASRSKPSGNTKNNRIMLPPSRNFTIVRNMCPLTRSTSNKIVPPKETTIAPVVTPTSGILVYTRRPKATRSVGSSSKVVQIVLHYLDYGCSKHLTGNRSQLINFVSKFLGTVRFENDHIAKIMGYGDYQMGNVTIYRVYYVEGLGHNLFSVGQFCDSVLEYQKDHLCSAYALGKSKKHSHKPKAEDSIQEKLYLLHMDLCGPIRIQSINGRKYILVIVDDFYRFTWVKFLRSKDEVPESTLRDYYEEVKISHQTLVSRTSQQNGVFERQKRTLVEAARTMLIFSKAPLFLWAEADATTCYTQNRSLIRKCHNKTPYELLHDQKPDLSYLHVFVSLCYPTNDGEDLGKLKQNADIGIFVG
ncbi:retrovirus-related pol polyprotein from transposon TNT 1-94 [Tanacetum coccineum]